MRFKKIAATVLALASSAVALAEDRTIIMPEFYPGTYLVPGEHVAGPVTAFDDTLMFVLPTTGQYNLNLGVIGDFLTQFSSVTLTTAQGTFALPTVQVGPFAFAQLGNMIMSGDSFSLALTGPYSAGYTVYAEASAVPESETYAMFLAGLGMIGFLWKRQSRLG